MKVHKVPKYIIRPSPERLLIDKFLALIILGFLLYLGIYLNYYVVSADIPTLLNYIIITLIIIMLSLELILCYVSYADYSYEFYEDEIVIKAFRNKDKARKIDYSEIITTSFRANFIDRFSHTGSIVLGLKNGSNVRLRYLKNSNQALVYLQKHVKK